MQLVYMLFDKENKTVAQATFEIAEAIACSLAVPGSLQPAVELKRNEGGAFVPTKAGMNVILGKLMYHAAYKKMEAGAFTRETIIEFNEAHGVRNVVNLFSMLYKRYNELNVPIIILE